MAAPTSPAEYAAAISTVAAAQICQYVGFRRADPAAVRLLSDLLGRYLSSVGALAAAAANSHGRTESNLLDLIHAAETLRRPRGFPGAADPSRPLLRSAILRELASFVASVDEIPFAVPLRRGQSEREAGACFAAEIREEQPLPLHVPRWLPLFPVSKADPIRERKREEALWPAPVVSVGGEVSHGGGGGERIEHVRGASFLPWERRRVRFRVRGSVGGTERDVTSAGKCALSRRGDGEESCFEAARKLRRCEGPVCTPMASGIRSVALD